jgi:predicted dehydrogenase
MNERVGIGVVGAGSIGIRGALEHLSLPDVQDKIRLVAVCDAGRAKAAAQKYGVPSAYESYDELLANHDVDLITIGTPIGLHYDQGVAAANAGKHIHFNKTMTTDSDEAIELIALAEKKGVKIVASPGQMTQPQNRLIRKLIKEGELGRLAWASVGAGFGAYHEQESLRTSDENQVPINPSWYWKKPGGGPMYDMTVYGLHTLTGILGPAKRVIAFSDVAVKERQFLGVNYSCDADDNTLAVLDFGNALFAYVSGTFAGSLSEEFGQPNFYGVNGTVIGTKLNGKQIDFPGREIHSSPYQLGPHIKGAHINMGEAHVFEDIMQLVDFVRLGTQPVGSPQHASHVIEIIEAAYRSAESGQVHQLRTTFTPID